MDIEKVKDYLISLQDKICSELGKIDGSEFHLNEYLDGQRINEHLLIAAPENLRSTGPFGILFEATPISTPEK